MFSNNKRIFYEKLVENESTCFTDFLYLNDSNTL